MIKFLKSSLSVVLASLVALASSCKSGGALSGGDEGALSAVPKNLVSHVVRIDSKESYESFSVPGSGLIPGSASMKFLMEAKDKKSPWKTYYMNAHYSCVPTNSSEANNPDFKDCTKYHYNFASYVLKSRLADGRFNDNTYFRDKGKYFVAGTVNRYLLKDEGEIYGIQLFPQDLASEQTIVDIAESIKNSLSIPDSKIKFVATGNQQSVKDPAQIKRLSDMGVELMPLDAILGSLSYIPMNVGEAVGYLRMFPKNQDDLLPTDIAVFDELPLDLSVVAGVITKSFQDSNSHINLKSKERNTPNLVLRNVGPESGELSKFINLPVKLIVKGDRWTIELSTDTAVQAAYQKKIGGKVPTELPGWGLEAELKDFEDMCPGNPKDCLALNVDFGGKSANLGFLTTSLNGLQIKLPNTGEIVQPKKDYSVPRGFGIPIHYYERLVTHNRELSEKLKIFQLALDERKLSNAEIVAQSAEIRKMFLNAELPAIFDSVLVRMKEYKTSDLSSPSVNEWKIRSSASAEDIEGFDGAGLHDSYAGKLDKKNKPDNTCILEVNPPNEPGELAKMKVSPKSVACAIKGVYASLWNKRAIDERSYAFIKQSKLGMGLAVVPTYDNEGYIAANSVVVTRIVNSDIAGISLSIQDKNNTVTNPTPGTWSELTMAISYGKNEKVSYTTVRFAKPLADQVERTTPVLSSRNNMIMTEVARLVEEEYCKAKPSYYADFARRRDPSLKNRRIEDVCLNVSFDPARPKALDFETKVLCDPKLVDCSKALQVGDQGVRTVFKQVREFAGQ